MKMLFHYLHPFFSEFKWYRKRKGGRWFKILDKDVKETTDCLLVYWTQSLDGEITVLEEEVY